MAEYKLVPFRSDYKVTLFMFEYCGSISGHISHCGLLHIPVYHSGHAVSAVVAGPEMQDQTQDLLVASHEQITLCFCEI